MTYLFKTELAKTELLQMNNKEKGLGHVFFTLFLKLSFFFHSGILVLLELRQQSRADEEKLKTGVEERRGGKKGQGREETHRRETQSKQKT